MLQSAMDVALCVVRANPDVLEGLGAHLEGKIMLLELLPKKFCFLKRDEL